MSKEVLDKIKKYKTTEQAVLLSTRSNLEKDEMDYLSEIIQSYEMEWPLYIGIVFYNRLNGVAYRNNLTVSGFPRRAMFNLRSAFENMYKRAKLHCEEISKINEIFEQEEISFAFLKGSVLNTIYYEFGERMSNDTDILVRESDLGKVDKILKAMGYIQGIFKNGEIIPATKKEILFARLNTYETFPYVKKMDDANFPVHEIDINFKLENGKSGESASVMLQRTVQLDKEDFHIRTLEKNDFLIFLCIHHFREATMMYKIIGGDDLTLYKYLDIHTFLNKTTLDWDFFVRKVNEYKKEKEVYHTLWCTEELYPGTICEEVFDLFKIDDVHFLNEYKGKENTDITYEWKEEFYKRVFNEKRKFEAMENLKTENERFKKIMKELKGE